MITPFRNKEKIMKKILIAILVFIFVSMWGCSCDNHKNPSKKAEKTSNTISESKIRSKKIIKWQEPKASDIRTDSVTWDASGGMNYELDEEKAMIYSGKEVSMRFDLSLGTSEKVGMSVYLYINGVFVPFSLREFEDGNFEVPLTSESPTSDYHQLVFNPNKNTEKDKRFFIAKFKPNMFNKGETVYPMIIGNVNNTFIPSNMSNISTLATSAFAVYPPSLKIKADKTKPNKTDKKFYTKVMGKDFNEENDSNVVNINLISSKSTNKNYVKMKRGKKLKLTAQAYTKRDDYGEYDDRKIILSVIVNDKPVKVFDKSAYLELAVNKNKYYNRDFRLDTSKLKKINRVQITSCQFGTEDEGNTFLMTSDVFYVEVYN